MMLRIIFDFDNNVNIRFSCTLTYFSLVNNIFGQYA